MRKIITFSTVVLTIASMLFLTSSSPVQAKTFKWAFQGDFQTLDPHSLNETFQLGFIGNIYEGLIRNGADLKILPALAEKWEVAEPDPLAFLSA
jgi:peptide/nickel transport system substrate-binding protein